MDGEREGRRRHRSWLAACCGHACRLANRVVALEPETGKLIWEYVIDGANASMRGVEYWAGDKSTTPEIFFGTTDGKLVALNAKTGKPVPGFGREGLVDMKSGIANGFTTGQFSLSSPPKIVKDVIITGARVQESPSLGFSGDTRGWDVHTGKLLWQFHLGAPTRLAALAMTRGRATTGRSARAPTSGA